MNGLTIFIRRTGLNVNWLLADVTDWNCGNHRGPPEQTFLDRTRFGAQGTERGEDVCCEISTKGLVSMPCSALLDVRADRYNPETDSA